MNRNEFLKLYPLPNDKNLEVFMPNKLIECIHVKTIYNRMLNALRPSLMSASHDYIAKATSIWSNSVYSDLEKAQSDETIKQAIEKSKITKELIKRGYQVSAEIEIIPVTLVTGDIHHYNVYVKFFASVQSLFLYWKNENVKRKAFIFVEDGVFQITYPPYNLKDNSPYGFQGIQSFDDSLVICE